MHTNVMLQEAGNLTYDRPIAVAIETTGQDPYRDDIVKIAAITYRHGERVDSFCRDTRDDNCTLATMLAEFVDYVGAGQVCIAHDGKLVKIFLRRATNERLKLDIIDTMDLARICFPSLQCHELADLAQLLAIPVPSEQSAANCCELTMLLWQKLVDHVRTLPPELVNELNKLFASAKGHCLTGFFHVASDWTKRQGEGRDGRLSSLFRGESLPPRRQLPDITSWEKLDADEMAAIFDRTGSLAAKLKGYEARPQQGEMARAVATAFNDSKHLVVEAGTGIGKSLAYLAPAVMWSSVNDTPVVVSTNTKNLQSQLFYKDLPLLREILQKEFDAVLIKGRKNYVCLRKLCYLTRHAAFELSRRDRVAVASAVAWATSTKTGDISECFACGMSADDDVSDLVTSDRGECRGQDCDYRRKCFLFRARRKALAADVIIANHSVVFAEIDMDEGSPVLPPYRHIVFDEAHNLEAAATSWLSAEISAPRLRYLLARLWRPDRRRTGSGLVPAIAHNVHTSGSPCDYEIAEQIARHTTDIVAGVAGLDVVIDEFFKTLDSLLTPDKNRESLRVRAAEKNASQWGPIMAAKETLAACLATVTKSTDALAEALRVMEETGPVEQRDYIQDLQGVLEGITKFSNDLEFVLAAESEGYVFWVARTTGQGGGVSAWGAPVHIGPKLNDLLYSRKDSVIMTSATLSVGGSLAFTSKRIGLDLVDGERLREINMGTPFDYSRQCVLMVPLFLPDPAEPGGDYTRQLAILLSEVFRRTRGRGMTLFTSYDMLRRTSSVLRDEMTDDGIQLLVQGGSGTRESIIATFKEDIGSVLMGTHSFWEGVDVVGESLSCLVVARLPFAVFKDPIIEARCEQVEADGGNAFLGFSVPNAVIRFRQGFGRLIRHRSDRGMVIVTDRRIVSRRYGQWFRNSVPVRTVKFNDRDEFLDAVEAFMIETADVNT